MKDNNILIVGGGISGLVSAAYLSKNNINVTLLEKCNRVGGLIGSYESEGFLIDSGIRALENSGVIFPMLKDLGINLNFKKNIVSVKIKDKSIQIKDEKSLNDYENLLISFFPKDKNEIHEIIKIIRRVSDYMDVLYGIDNPLFLDMKKDQKYLIKSVLPWMLKYKKTIKKIKNLNDPVNDYLKTITSNQELIDTITQHFFKDTPTFFALSYFKLYNDYYYPEKGIQSFIDSIYDYIIKNGGNIILNSEVSKINLEDKEIISNDKSYKFNKLIWAADLNNLYKNIEQISEKNTNLSLMNNKKSLMNKSHGNDSIYSIYLKTNLDSLYLRNQCSEHTFFTPNTKGLSSMEYNEKQLIEVLKNTNAKKSTLKKWLKEFANKTTYEISIPALRFEDLAPKGKSAIIISTVYDYNLTAYLEEVGLYEYLKDNLNKEIINIINNTLFNKLKENIISFESSTPRTIEKMLNNSDGAITGWSFSYESPVENRMKKMAKAIYTPFNDIYQTGHWVFSPTGMPTSIMLGKILADKIVKDFK